jgi:sodium/bile acid cotransporter 7
VVMVVIALLLAKAYPPLGADYLQPQITSTWIAVIFIFGAYH